MMSQPHNLAEFFAERLSRHSAKPAITCLGKTITYGELDELSSRFAKYLHYELKLEVGDRLAIQLPNLIQYPIVALAAFKLGLVIVNTNPLYTDRELRHQFNDANVKAVVVLRGVSTDLAEVLPDTPVKHVIVTEVGDIHGRLKKFLINTVLRFRDGSIPSIEGNHKFTDFLQPCTHAELPNHLSTLESLAMLQYTGGTTGLSKGAMLSHKNLLSNLKQVNQVLRDKLTEGEEVIVAPLPVYHIFAFMLCMLVGVNAGARLILIPDPRNQKQFVDALKGVKFTFFAGLNTLFNALCRNEEFRKLDFSGLHLTVSGGMALMKDTAEQWEAVTGCKVLEGYGLTETSPVVAINPPNAPRLGTVGFPVPGTQCRLVDSEGNQVQKGESGELWVRGPQVMQGYWNKPDETAGTMTAEGWLKTGDVARFDEDGYLSIVDRIKDMILVSGFNVYPNEVEDVISKHPDVVECAVIGVPDPESVEAVKLFVVTHNPSLDEAEIRRYARDNLTAYKVPKVIQFIEELPKSNVGKVLRRELKGK